MTGTTALTLLVTVGLVLVAAWNIVQFRRVDALEKRVDALEKK